MSAASLSAASPSVSSILSSFHECISTISSVSLLPHSRPFYFLSASSTLSDALHLLSTHRILSAPVFDTSRDICLGACSLLTIATFLAKENARRGGGLKKEGKEGETGGLLETGNWLEKENKVLAEVKLVDVMKNENMRASLATFYEENPLSQLIDYFQTRLVHRVALISRSCEITHPCSQSDVIGWICKQFTEKKFEQLAALTIQQVLKHVDDKAGGAASNFHHSKPICVLEYTPVVAALDTMSRHNISCVGVLNSTGQLIANFSPADLRGLKDLQYLSLSVVDYLKKFSPSSLSPLFIKSSTTFSSFVHSIHAKHVHRGWLTDDFLCPLRVVTLSDLMTFLASGNRVTEEAANAGKDVSKLWTAKMMDAAKTVDTSHLFQKTQMTELSSEMTMSASGSSERKLDPQSSE